MKHSFKLSNSNKIYLGLVAVIYIVLFLLSPNKTSYEFGRFSGGLLGFLIIPSLFAWIVWRLTGRKQKGGSITFNILLSILILGRIGQAGNNIRRSVDRNNIEKLQALERHGIEFKEEISTADNPTDMDRVYNKYTNSIISGFNELSESGTDTEKQFYRIMSEFVTETQVTVRNWNQSFNEVMSPRILDYSLLINDEEFANQKQILTRYVAQTGAYKDVFSNMVPNLKKRLAVLGGENEHAKGAIMAANEKYFSQKKVMEPFLAAHFEYGRTMIQILDFLQKNEGDWGYVNDELFFKSEDARRDYNELVDKLGRSESIINTLSSDLYQQM